MRFNETDENFFFFFPELFSKSFIFEWKICDYFVYGNDNKYDTRGLNNGGKNKSPAGFLDLRYALVHLESK